MKMIDVLIKIANDEIKDKTVLEIYDPRGRLYTYTFNGEKSYFFKLENKFLNFEVRLIPPKPKKYYLKLNKDNIFSYVNLNRHNSYELSTKDERLGYKTKFTQEEIDDNEFLKFVEQYGVKEEAKNDEND